MVDLNYYENLERNLFKMELLDKHIIVMKNYLQSAINHLDKRCVFSAFEDIVKCINVFAKYVYILQDIRNGKLK